MTTHDALLAAILTEPAEDTPRLMYADFLIENDQPERAEFIRIGCELARLGPPHLVIEEECPVDTRYGPNYFALTGGEDLKGGGRLIMEVKVGDRVDILHAGSFRKQNTKAMYGLRCSKITDDEVIVVRDEHSKPWAGDKLRARERELLEANRNEWSIDPAWVGAQCAAMLGGNWYGSLAGSWNFSRGFVSQVTCTAADWLKHADAVFWSPGQTVPCDCCGTLYGIFKNAGCTGRIPRPFVATAQPLTKVVLTDWELSRWIVAGHGIQVGSANTTLADDRWPGIVFEVRPDPSLDMSTDDMMTPRYARGIVGRTVGSGQIVSMDEEGRVVPYDSGR